MDCTYKKNGFKTSWFGNKFWIVYHHFAYHNLDLDPQVRKLFYTTPQYLLPCIFCRISYKEFLSRPENNLDAFIKAGKLPEWTWKIHNLVNIKLNKPVVDYNRCVQEYRDLAPTDWIEAFWLFVFTIALNYPANFQLTSSNQVRENPKVVTNVRRSPAEMTLSERDRYNAYVMFYDNIPNFLPAGEFCCRWMRSYSKFPLSPLSLRCRENLVRWLHCLALDTGGWKKNLRQTIEFIENYRAKSCDKTKKTCS